MPSARTKTNRTTILVHNEPRFGQIEDLPTFNRFGFKAEQGLSAAGAVLRALLVERVGMLDHLERVAAMPWLSASWAGFGLG